MNELQQPLIKRFPTIWAVIISVVLTAVIVGGGVYLWQKSALKQLEEEMINTRQTLQRQISNLQNQITQPQQPTIKEETTWQNFILGREGGFTFQYPGDWVIVPDQSVESPDWQHLKQGAQFLFFIDPEGIGFEYLEKKLGTSNVYLDNILATKTLFSDESGEVIAAIITFDKNKHSYWFKYEFVAKNGQEKDRYLTILDHIIATFKFK